MLQTKANECFCIVWAAAASKRWPKRDCSRDMASFNSVCSKDGTHDATQVLQNLTATMICKSWKTGVAPWWTQHFLRESPAKTWSLPIQLDHLRWLHPDNDHSVCALASCLCLHCWGKHPNVLSSRQQALRDFPNRFEWMLVACLFGRYHEPILPEGRHNNVSGLLKSVMKAQQW